VFSVLSGDYNHSGAIVCWNFMNKSDLGRALSALRKTHGGGGSKRRIVHDPELSYCRCVDCRKARGQYPAHLLDKPVRKAKRKAGQ
jgi:hypothetical protein